ncbi:mitogen-activated kinase kinase kinase YODA-like [Olea europaea subsp. europaea]|uniref:Mitogen-activated kinase kinase kinase YODA-like n=3 Tax=Olea europaea subsp. europaea TaxID=158383 RepID=A0A8S0SBQ6_OLEEU|nr:mitogen-activated kinase kinase kinase YODA-like [Olea europaea subsp. europaea]
MAPELLQSSMQKRASSNLAFAVDIWSLGCTIIEMLNGKPPWSEYEGAAALFKVLKETPPIPETLSADGKDFLRCCLRRNPAERPKASFLLAHQFVKQSHKDDPLSCTHHLMD